MMQLIAAIPNIFSAINKVSDLFGKGRQTVQQITGQASVASTPEELQTEVQQMSLDQQNRWAEIMAREVDQYLAQNERLGVEIGLVDSHITSKLDASAASKIALMRMTTRPWAVRWMVYYVMFPFFLVVIDLIQNLLVTWLPFLQRWIQPFNAFEYVFGVMRWPDHPDPGLMSGLAQLFSQGQGPVTFAGQLYMESIPWVVGIIVSYMGLREIGKIKGVADKKPEGQLQSASPPSVVTEALHQGVSLVGNIRSWFKK
ncbi:hypothetical protein [Bowmanella dokdonensis]|uniref:Uncharacterized protein n=1 Tax=Bowmanella dokdonensis TaxID=751969 RepID=A0A939DRJ5_9ALTE|nr:hypothetical protein [Bowmanella dokdonensis]MBN7826915.1 hypothetical protein [Bowmanella dokdonensis]